MISKTETTYFKGIAIILVLLGHCVPQFLPFAEVYVPIKRLLSQVGVEVFMILSGFGVAVSYAQRGCGPRYFLTRRFIRLWPVYALSILFYALVSTLWLEEKVSLADFFTNLLWIQVFFKTQNVIYSASHFFSALLVAYLLAALMLLQKGKGKYYIYICSLGLFQLFSYIQYGTFLFADYLASFSFGIFLSTLGSRGGERSDGWIMLLSYVFCLFDSYIALKAGMGICIWWVTRELIRKDRVSELSMKSLHVLGIYSYVIYLGHNYFLWKWPAILERIQNVTLTGIVILGATFLWILVLSFLNAQLNKRLVLPALHKAEVMRESRSKINA